MNWFKKSIVLSGKAQLFRDHHMPKWGLLHKKIAERLGIDLKDPVGLDQFMELSKIISDLTDELDRFPKFDEIWPKWLEIHPEWHMPPFSVKNN